jgi:tetrahydromethanopterin S-methyltransferase subunit E
MKDFVRMLFMLVLVFASMAGVVYLNYSLNQTTLAIVAGVIAVVIIVLVYRNFQRWFGPR